MNSIKAILAGILFISIVTLLIQLAIIFLTVGYHYLAKSLPLLHEISVYFRYFLAYPIFFVVLFTGGYITAAIAKKRVLLHCLLVACVTVGISTLSALDYMTLTLTGMLLILLALFSVVFGGWYWHKRVAPSG